MIEPTDETVRLLTEIRDDQRALLATMSARSDAARQLQERAEAIQERSAKIMNTVQRVMPVALVVITILILYVSWLLFRIMR